MKYSNFCAPFYLGRSGSTLHSARSKAQIAEYFLALGLGESANELLIYETSTFTKFFNGDREVHSSIWKNIVANFDEAYFINTLCNDLIESQLSYIAHGFEISLTDDAPVSKEALSAALAKQFLIMAKNAGSVGSIMQKAYAEAHPSGWFKTYAVKSERKYSKMKTLLYTSAEECFDDFFVCNTIGKRRNHSPAHASTPDSSEIENATLEILRDESQFILLVGMGGMGKSMMMRHLFLESVRSFSTNDLLPILVILRGFGTNEQKENNLYNLILASIKRFDPTVSVDHLSKYMQAGKCQILLDGLDEISPADLNFFTEQLDALIDTYPQNQYVMSSRRFSSFVSLSRFNLFWIRPFSQDQSLSLVRKLKYYEEEPALKQGFIEKLQQEYFRTHSEFAENPLLLTLMLMNYRRYADVPERKYLFYEQAYETLLQRHDADKLGYKRVFHSVTDPTEFTQVISEFCAKTYRKGVYEFDRHSFEEHFSTLKSVKKLDSPLMTVGNFLDDTCNSVCLMFEEGRKYHFLHRSFQEYFFAKYYANQTNEVLEKLGQYMVKEEAFFFDEGGAINMLYELASEKVERFIILPYLSSIFTEEDPEANYWNFLEIGFRSWNYYLFDSDLIELICGQYGLKKESMTNRSTPNNFSTYCVVMTLIIDIVKGQELLEANPDLLDSRLKYPDSVTCDCIACLRQSSDDVDNSFRNVGFITVPREYIEEARKPIFKNKIITQDENGDPLVIGHKYSLDIRSIIDDGDLYSPAVNFLEDVSCPMRELYEKIAEYFTYLKDVDEQARNMDDDDF